MIRIFELIGLINAIGGIATFLGWRHRTRKRIKRMLYGEEKPPVGRDNPGQGPTPPH